MYRKKYIIIIIPILLFFSCYDRILLIQDGLEGKDLIRISAIGREEIDLKELEKVSLKGFQITDYNHPSVQKWIQYYSTSGKKWLQKVFERSGYYLPQVREIFEEKGIPLDLAYLPIIESGYNPKAVSPASATGAWQFMYGTGILYGLKADRYWYDDRRDIKRSTYAATLHLKYLYKKFDSWLLALAAYNAGGGKISTAIKKYNTKNYWELIKYQYIKPETKNYIPKFIAATIIAKNPTQYGFNPIKEIDPKKIEEILIDDATDLQVIADCAGVSLHEIKQLNPRFKQWSTPPGMKFEVNIPADNVSNFIYHFSSIGESERVTFRRHLVGIGESVSTIAQRYKVPINPIADLNKLSSIHSIHAGSYLFIPIKGLKNAAAADRENKLSFQSSGKYYSFLYAVKTGDTLYKIAVEFEIEINDIMRWNKLFSYRAISPGDLILLKKKIN